MNTLFLGPCEDDVDATLALFGRVVQPDVLWSNAMLAALGRCANATGMQAALAAQFYLTAQPLCTKRNAAVDAKGIPLEPLPQPLRCADGTTCIATALARLGLRPQRLGGAVPRNKCIAVDLALIRALSVGDLRVCNFFARQFPGVRVYFGSGDADRTLGFLDVAHGGAAWAARSDAIAPQHCVDIAEFLLLPGVATTLMGQGVLGLFVRKFWRRADAVQAKALQWANTALAKLVQGLVGAQRFAV